jgi:ribonuclease BN (tRNA processing enzyme)
MKIKILGTRGEIDASGPYHSKQSGILVDEMLMLDAGEKSFLIYRPKWILISHLHPDHAFFVRKGHEEIPQTDAQIFAPEKPAYQEIAAKIDILDKRKRLGDYEITPIPSHHSKHVKSQAYLVKKESHAFLYTADLVWINKEFHALFDPVELVITEASFLRKGGMIRRDASTGEIYGHNGIPDLIHFFKKFTKKIIFMHFGSWFYKSASQARKAIKQLGKEDEVEALVAYDGMEVEL